MVLLTALSLLMATLQTQTLKSDFTFTVTANQSQPMTYNGAVTMQGERFMFQMLSMEAAYDGKTLYIYQEETDELTLSNPTQEELSETNPFYMAKTLMPLCNVTERESKSGEEVYITLTPKQQTSNGAMNREMGKLTMMKDLVSLTVKVRKADNMPLSMELREKQQTSSLRMTNPRYVKENVVWVVNKPNAFVNDLRE